MSSLLLPSYLPRERRGWLLAPTSRSFTVAVCLIATSDLLGVPPSFAAEQPAPAKQPAPAARPGTAGGCEAETEDALAAGLQWLVCHQAADGHWALDDFHRHARDPGTGLPLDGPCRCTGRGIRNDVAGTAFGLLPLLAAGQTHRRVGPFHPYAANVERGLHYLLGRQEPDGHFGGGMYAHALATLAVCEAYRLTADPLLQGAAQRALDFIARRQHEAGGWRYDPGQAGDTSVTGWQVEALKRGQLAGLKVPRETLDRAGRFLDLVGTADGSGYGYTGPHPTPTMTASGLLCRLHLGWKPSHPGVLAGAAKLRKQPPGVGPASLYSYHRVTALLERVGGDDWGFWEPRMRRWLLDRQELGADPKTSHRRGSWPPADDSHGGVGGRLMITSLALLTLQSCARADLPRKGPARQLTDEELDALWTTLAEHDPVAVRRAVRTLAGAPGQVVPYLKRRLQPAAAADPKQVSRLIAQLDDGRFRVREKATAELGAIGEQAEAALRHRLQDRPSAESRRRIEELLLATERRWSSAEGLQVLRSLEVLVRADRPQARELLQALAAGAPQARLTREARACLERLGDRERRAP